MSRTRPASRTVSAAFHRDAMLFHEIEIAEKIVERIIFLPLDKRFQKIEQRVKLREFFGGGRMVQDRREESGFVHDHFECLGRAAIFGRTLPFRKIVEKLSGMPLSIRCRLLEQTFGERKPSYNFNFLAVYG